MDYSLPEEHKMKTLEPAQNKNDEAPEKSDKIKAEKKRIYKNIILISVGFLCNFISFQGLARLQSSLHIDQGMGVINSSVIYAALVLSCLFLPRFIISKLGHKWTICGAVVGYILWMAANGYAVWGTMVTASIIVGLCAAPLWTAQCSYFTKLGIRYSLLSGETQDAVITRFFGIFFMFFQMSSIFASVIMSTILNQRPENDTSPSAEDLELCGADDCPWNNGTNVNLRKPPRNVVWTLVGVYIAVATIAVVLIGIFMDKLPQDIQEEDKKESEQMSGIQMLVATVRQLRMKEQLLLIPITIYSGLEQALYNAEWTKSFISCTSGIWMVGWMTLPFGFVNATASLLTGRVVKYTGRLPVFLSGFVVDLCIQITLTTWSPEPDKAYVMYILSGMWGFTDAVWQTQINGMYGCVFSSSSEAAFSNYRMWESLGFILGFAYSNFLCTSVKIYIAMSFLCMGMLGYLLVEWLTRKLNQEKKEDGNETSMKKGNGDQQQHGGHDNLAHTYE